MGWGGVGGGVEDFDNQHHGINICKHARINIEHKKMTSIKTNMQEKKTSEEVFGYQR